MLISRNYSLATFLAAENFVFTTFVGVIAHMIIGVSNAGKKIGKAFF